MTMRSQSFSDSRDSLLGSHSDFRHHAISKDFSNEIITELYGSKTSLLEDLLRRKSSGESDPDHKLSDVKLEKEVVDKTCTNHTPTTTSDGCAIGAGGAVDSLHDLYVTQAPDPFSPADSMQDEQQHFQPISRQKLVERWQNDTGKIFFQSS